VRFDFRPFCHSLAFGAGIAALASVAGCGSPNTIPSVDRPPSAGATDRGLPPKDFKVRTIPLQMLSLTKSSEGWLPYRYNDAAKYCTIGYGHVIKKSPCDGHEPTQFLHRLSQQSGEQLLISDMRAACYSVMTSVEVDLTDSQFAALSDFVFNVGSGNFQRSTLLKVVNTGEEPERIPGQFRRWVMAAGKTWPGLVERRKREIYLFFEGHPPIAKAIPGEDLSPVDILSDDTGAR
jgi:GH24 family phage-related lysozyme (muramidase)